MSLGSCWSRASAAHRWTEKPIASATAKRSFSERCRDKGRRGGGGGRGKGREEEEEGEGRWGREGGGGRGKERRRRREGGKERRREREGGEREVMEEKKCMNVSAYSGLLGGFLGLQPDIK